MTSPAAAEPSSSGVTTDADGIKAKTSRGVSSYLGGVDLSVQVLTTGSWPVKGQNVGTCTLPPDMQAACDAYRTFTSAATTEGGLCFSRRWERRRSGTLSGWGEARAEREHVHGLRGPAF